jgi:hypothetical protein
MKKLVTTSIVSLCTLALFSGCGGGGNHAKDAGTTGTAGSTAGNGGAGGGVDGGGGAGGNAGGAGGGAGATAGSDGGTDTGPNPCIGAGACGGNIVASWNIVSSCLDVDVSGAVPDYCPAATAKAMGVQLTGTLTYNANLTYTKKTTLNGKIVFTFPASCLTGGDGGTLTCDQLATQLKLDPTYTDVSCATAGTACACTSTLAPQSQTKTGMYTTTSAGLLTESETGSTSPDLSDYCVKTDTLTTSVHSMGMGMMSATGVITATRVPPPPSDGGSDASDAPSSSEAGTDAGGDATGN